MTATLDLGIFSRPKVYHVRQAEVAECGLACLAMVASFHGLRIDMAVMRRRFAPSMRGASLRTLMTIADRMNLTPRAVQADLQQLRALALPAVLHWDMKHYVVIERIARRKALIHDPSGSSEWVRFEDLSKHYTGVALELRPTDAFEPGEERKRLRLSSLWTRVYGFKRAVAQTIVLSIVIQAFALASPYYLQLAIDRATPELNSGFLGVLALGFGLFAILNGVAILIRSSTLLVVGSTFGYGLSSNIARKLFRLPIEWFVRRHIADVLSRFQSVVPIRQMLAEDAPATLVDGVLTLLTLVIMLIYSPMLAMLAIFAVAVFSLIKAVSFSPQRRAREEMIVAGGQEQSVLIESMHGIRALRLAGRETMRHAVWQARMTEAINGSIRSQRITNWQLAIQTTLFALENVLSIWLAVSLVISGTFSIGMIFAFSAYKIQFITAASSLISRLFDFRMLGLHLERISEIALSDDHVGLSGLGAEQATFCGNIELRDVHYRYGGDEPFVLRGVNLKISSGQSIAITGPSGGGKSTLVQILLGLVEPTLGELLVDGLPIARFGYQSYYAQIGAVLQDDTLFGGSLSENISLFDEAPDIDRVKECACLAAIEDDIMAMPMGFETLVGEMGIALSGGQRQRVLLARALYRDPSVLIMDEGTSHLDETRERQVNNAVKTLGITRIIVAHRRETISSADLVYVLQNGVLIQKEFDAE